MTVKIQLRRGTAEQWTSANPTLLSGEQGLETDTSKTKIGDGVTAWNSLGYVDAKFLATSASSSFVGNSLISATKGALITSTGSAVAAQTVGTNGFVLTADSGQTNGIKWAAAASGADIDPLFLAGV